MGGNSYLFQKNKGFTAAACVLTQYQERFTSKHKEEAMNVIAITTAFAQGGEIVHRTFQNKAIMQIFVAAVMKNMGISPFQADNIDEALKKKLITECANQKNAPSIQTQKNCLALLLDGIMSTRVFSAANSSLASAFFVLVKKLNLPVEKETKVKIIKAANFSMGFLHTGTDATRRAQELALLQRQNDGNEALQEEEKQSSAAPMG